MFVRQRFPLNYLIVGMGMLLMGILIYIAGRGASSPVYQMIPGVHILENTWVDSGIRVLLKDNALLLYSLPDGLWMFAVMSIQLWIWERQINTHSVLWMTIVYIICLTNEGLQSVGLSPGTYDNNDIFFMMVGGILPILIEFTLQKTLRWKESKNQS